MAVQLTPSAITTICSNHFSSIENLKPVLQVIHVKLFPSQDRYCLVLSDGSHYQQSILATKKNHLLTSGTLQTGSIIVLTLFTTSVIQNSTIIIIVDLDVILKKCNPIGTPVSANFDESYANRNMGFCNPESQASISPFQNSYVHQPQPMHQQPMKMPEAKENFTPSVCLDIQAVLKRCEIVEKEVQSLKDCLSLINRKDSEQRKQIEDLRKQNAELAGEKQRLLQAIQGILSENRRI
ncbi:replication protein A 70 kDa DNA-binding subunit C [Arachis duranensis]|uniref:Replication protein A 70 kDa DNA-binding subunit C n=1 Tax=Arachis duranensis TaxID=130453 RepID=A0A6P4D6I4_ARADU|nr:replication protein A 70 kDa DNA-binding subunit C [Arachis duranensis]